MDSARADILAARQHLQQQGLLAFPRRAGHPERSPMREQLRQAAALFVDISRNIEIELDVAGDVNVAAAKGTKALAMRLGLRCNAGKQAEHASRQFTAFRIASGGTL